MNINLLISRIKRYKNYHSLKTELVKVLFFKEKLKEMNYVPKPGNADLWEFYRNVNELCPGIGAILDDNVKKVILVSTLGGCTGSVVTPILAEYITKKRVEVYCIVSLPFIFEGEQTMKKAQKAVAEMSLFSMQTLIFNSELYRRQSCNQSVIRFFTLIDKYFHKSIFSISKGR